MPTTDGTSALVADEEVANSVLSRFLGVPEQTYEEFLSTFSCLPKGADIHHSHAMLDGSQIPKVQTTPGTLVASEEDEPEQLTIGEGTTVGHCHSLTYPGRVQVDNYFHSSDIDPEPDNDETSPSVLLFPGEADMDLPGDQKPIVRNTCLQIHSSSGVEIMADEESILDPANDEIRPFSLDQSFDYDRVTLTPKLSEDKMNFLRLRGPRKAEETENASET